MSELTPEQLKLVTVHQAALDADRETIHQQADMIKRLALSNIELQKTVEGAKFTARQASVDAEYWRKAVQDMSARWSVDVLAEAMNRVDYHLVDRWSAGDEPPNNLAAAILAALPAPRPPEPEWPGPPGTADDLARAIDRLVPRGPGITFPISVPVIRPPEPWKPSTVPFEAHKDDSYGQCVVCRVYVPHTDGELLTEPYPCPTVRLVQTTGKTSDGSTKPEPDRDALVEALTTQRDAAERRATILDNRVRECDAGMCSVDRLTLERLVQFVGNVEPAILDAFAVMFPDDASLATPEPSPLADGVVTMVCVPKPWDRHWPEPKVWGEGDVTWSCTRCGASTDKTGHASGHPPVAGEGPPCAWTYGGWWCGVGERWGRHHTTPHRDTPDSHAFVPATVADGVVEGCVDCGKPKSWVTHVESVALSNGFEFHAFTPPPSPLADRVEP